MTGTAANVRVKDDKVHVTTPAGRRSYAVGEMPEEFFRWQLESRLALSQSLAGGDSIREFHAHLPVAATLNEELVFPLHTATKATGLLPQDTYLGDYHDQLAACLRTAADRPWEETQRLRVAAALRLYENPAHIDRRKLGLVEIFQGQTYRNLLRAPLMALQYTGPGPSYRSYQLNGVIEMVGPGDPRFEFLFLMRQLFERDSFHVQQPAYPSGYLFWISQVFDKSPRGQAGRRIR